MKTAAYNIQKIPNAVTQAAIDELEAMVRGEGTPKRGKSHAFWRS